MVDYLYPSRVALDPATGNLVVNGSLTVHAISDTSGSNPLPVTDPNGLPLSAVKTTRQGLTEPFKVANHDAVALRSGTNVVVIESFEGIRDAAVDASESAAAAAASAASSEAKATEFAALKGWVDQGVTTRNVILDPRATDAAKWSAVNAPSTELMVTGATDGPTLPDGSKVTTYARYTMTADVGSIATSFGYQVPNEDVGAWPSGTRLAASIYIRSSVALPASYPALSQQAPGAPWVESGAQRQSTVLTAIPANTWVRLADMFTSTANAGAFGTRAYVPSGSSALLVGGAVVEVTAALAAPGAPSAPDHWDGDSPSTSLVGYGWEGARNGSISRRIDMRLMRALKVNGGTLLPDATGTVDLGTLGGGASDHGALSGLGDDDHPQYLNNARADQRYYSRAQVDSLVAAAATQTSAADRDRANHTGLQSMGSISGLAEALASLATGAVGPDVPRVRVVSTGNEPRPEGVAFVIWLDGRADTSQNPVNMGENDLRLIGAFTGAVDLTAPTVPTGLSSSNITQSGVTLSWTASTDDVGVTGYEVFRNGTISLGIHPTAPTATTRQITGLTAGTTHTFEVRARDAAGNQSARSAPIEITTLASTDTVPPTVPTGLAASNVGPSSFTVTWGAGTDNIGVAGYDVRINGGAWVQVEAEPRSRNFTSLSPETTHTVGIRTRDGAGLTSAEVTLNVTTTEATGETYSIYGAGAPTGTWTWSNDATPYIVTSRGFLCSAAGARVVGARAWIPAAAAGSLPTEATFYLHGPEAGLGTTPVQTKVVSTAGATAGSWVEALFDVPQAIAVGQNFVVGVRFTGAGDAGKYAFASDARPNNDAVISNGALGEELAWAPYSDGALSTAFRIGTGSVTVPGSGTQSYGIDILVDTEGV